MFPTIFNHSDGIEITIVKPIVKLKLEDYRLSKKLMKRLEERAEGILITGPPGSGKSSFASALAEFYFKKGKIVKTLESPRDLQVMDEITQYGPLEGDFEKTADILLLVRPDYSVFDEIRKSKDFQVFTDLRLAGVGMVGVIHASNPIDAIQRFIGKVELGIIPHLIDTIIFLKDGEIKDVYELNLTVKVPTGMTESDLARPVVEVKDFESGELKYEIYTFGEENVVVPVKKGKDIIKKLAEEKILDEVKKFDRNAEVVGENKQVIIEKYSPHFDRRHNVNFISSYTFGKDLNWEFSARWNIGSGFPFTQTSGFYEFVPFTDINTDYTTANGNLGIIYSNINEGRLPYYHRLDVALKHKFEISDNTTLETSLSITNVYNRNNIFYFSIGSCEQ